jgi:hypothetical protein
MWLLPQQPKGPPHGRLHNHFCLDPSPTPSPNHYLHLSVQSITCPQCLHSSPVLALGVVSCGNGSRSSYVRGAATPLCTRGVTQLNSSFIAAADDTDGSWMSHPAFALDVGFVQTTRICLCCAWCSGRSNQSDQATNKPQHGHHGMHTHITRTDSCSTLMHTTLPVTCLIYCVTFFCHVYSTAPQHRRNSVLYMLIKFQPFLVTQSLSHASQQPACHWRGLKVLCSATGLG